MIGTGGSGGTSNVTRRRQVEPAPRPVSMSLEGTGVPEGFRRCSFNGPPPAEPFLSNSVITSKYTALNFVPVFLFQQFSRFANSYFLFICILQCIPSISITGGIPYSLIPLTFVLFFDGVVTAREDFKRHQEDQAANARNTLVYRRNQGFRPTPWRDVVVGDVVKVLRGEEFPADLVFLAAQHDDPELCGMCHVQTAQLDGETNLKLRRAPDESVVLFGRDDAFDTAHCVVECENPTEHFGKFTGRLLLSAQDPNGLVLDANNTLLRGCVLRNVESVYGLVVYTGNQTKVRVKQTVGSLKKATVEREINRYIVALLGMQLLTCLGGAIGYAVFARDHRASDWYLHLDSVTFSIFVQRFFTFFLLNAAFIPVSLYVTMKLARRMQKVFIELDNDMVYVNEVQYKQTNGAEGEYRATVRTMDLNDELGQISHIFTDKTGTLTSNYMDFRKLTVNGVSYGLGTTEIGLARRRRLGMDVLVLEQIGKDVAAEPKTVPHVTFKDGSDSHPGRTIAADQVDSAHPDHAWEIHQMMLQLVLNHTIVLETVRDANNVVTGTQLSASSPDEEAFVYAGERFGYKFLNRSKDVVTVDIAGRGKAQYRVVAMLPYTQMRKMMSLIIEDMQPTGEHPAFFLFSKGADSTLMSKLAPPSVHGTAERARARAEVVRLTDSQLRDWAEDGLRTLVFAYKPLTRAEVDAFLEEFNRAQADLVERQKKEAKKPNRIDDVMAEMESNLLLQGATANEDRLQEDVPQTIALLAEAGIQFFMLTGDKQETAINIGFATQMLSQDFIQIVLTSESFEQHPDVARLDAPAGSSDAVIRAAAKQKAEVTVRLVKEHLHSEAETVRDMKKRHAVSPAPLAIIMDEVTLDVVFKDKSAMEDLLVVSSACRSTICCRCRPDQKKMMVSLVRNGIPSARTLAIGDGANDVDMILEAHVGVGIVGAEGVHAANASDFSIGRFKFLKRLLLVHGRWNYNRMAIVVCYMFFKNITFVLTQYWFQIFTGWSGQKFTVELATQAYNIMYTGLPILLVGVLDQDVSDATALKFPYLYTADGLLRTRLNLKLFMSWLLDSVYESLVLFFVPFFAVHLADHPNGLSGDSYSVFELGSVCFTMVVIVTNIRIAIATHSHHSGYQVILALSVLSWAATAFIFDALNQDRMKGGMQRIFGSANVWFTIPLTIAIALGPVAILTAYYRMFRPDYRDAVKEYEIIIPDSLDELTCHHKLSVWRTSTLLTTPVSEKRLKDWPHRSEIDYILARMRLGGSPEAEVEATEARLMRARVTRLIELGALPPEAVLESGPRSGPGATGVRQQLLSEGSEWDDESSGPSPGIPTAPPVSGSNVLLLAEFSERTLSQRASPDAGVHAGGNGSSVTGVSPVPSVEVVGGARGEGPPPSVRAPSTGTSRLSLSTWPSVDAAARRSFAPFGPPGAVQSPMAEDIAHGTFISIDALSAATYPRTMTTNGRASAELYVPAPGSGAGTGAGSSGGTVPLPSAYAGARSRMGSSGSPSVV